MGKMIVVPDSPVNTERLSNILESASVTVNVKTLVQNGLKETHYYVCDKNTIVYECVIRTFRPYFLEIAELESKEKTTKNSAQKTNTFLEPTKKRELCELVKKIEAKAFDNFVKQQNA